MAHTPKLWPMGQWATDRGIAECIELEDFGIIGAVIDTEGCDIIRRRALAFHDLLDALEACITDDGARAMIDESRNAAHTARRRLDEITRIARAAIAKAKGEV